MIKYIIEDMRSEGIKELVICSGAVNKLATLNKYDLTLSGELVVVYTDGKSHSIDGVEIEDYSIIDNRIYVYLD